MCAVNADSTVYAIELKDVSFRYEGSTEPVLKHVHFSVRYGEVALLSGLSGEGKSTLLSIVAGIIPNLVPGELTGEVLVDGRSTAGQKLSQICRRVGVVLQNADSQIVHQLTEDEIAFGCENFAMPAERIGEQIDRVCTLMGLDRTAQTRTLSGGQKQRLITASTLATGQKILILDEPLANLDRAGATELMDILRTLAEAGYAVLIVEHRLDMVLPFVDSVWSIRAGEVSGVENRQEYLLSQTVTIRDGSGSHAPGKKLFSLTRVAFSVRNPSGSSSASSPDRREILKDVSFDVYEGERLLLLGENGCGKTTLMRLMARLNRPTGGSITQNLDPGCGTHKAGKRWFAQIGVVYQNPNYQLFMPTVEQEVSFHAKSREYAEEMMRLFGLEHLQTRHPQSLSEGQKRRVSIAAVAAGTPKLLLLDEPTVGQDYNGLCELVRILNELHDRSGNTLITVTHDMRCAEALCDRAVLISDGRVQETGGKELVRAYFGI